ncbi:thiamine phosphate synthase [Hyphococcus sp.]|uniref:thiamine phosphate synthase n=1 Tax=Hyphococcus sp. TaxID=2038636 RepID=UPI00207E0D44|nr:MAG: thiamine-phosphate synthase [Marinicaulis sp.]
MENDSRLYLITPPKITDLHKFSDIFARALGAGNVACVQLRLKSPEGVSASDDEILRAADILAPIARNHETAFLINDRPDLVLKCGADGVHLGQSDESCKKARALLGEKASIGVTCHNSKHMALEAGEDGADYVAFGAFFPTQTKAASTTADVSLLEWWSYATTVPSVAIGGITPENCAPLVRAGADFLAASSAVWDCADGPEAAVEAFLKAIAAA